MESQPLISVLCLCYNQERFIIESLESIKAQTYKNFEILICDDFSKDNSVNVIESWILKNGDLRIKFLKHRENKGITKTLNELLKLAEGKYIQMLALDDILMPDKFERHVQIMEESSDNEAMVFSDAHLIDSESNYYQNKFIALHMSYLNLTTQNFHELLQYNNFIPAMSALIKKELLDEENGWDESLPFEDYDMWLRLSKGYSFIFDDVISCSYRLHDNNSHKKNTVINDSAMFKVFIKHTDDQCIRNKTFFLMENLYFRKQLTDEHKIFFNKYPVKSFPEICIKNRYHSIFYRLAIKFNRLSSLFNKYTS